LGSHSFRFRSLAAAVVCAGLAWAVPASAQVTPAAGHTPPDDTPSIKVGVTIFADYTIQQQPKITDADGNTVTSNSFNVGRSYINVTGNISHLIAFRVTPDITRETGAGSSLNGSYTFRLKYAFAQFNLDDWMTKGSWIRLGLQQTPFIDYAEGIYRYRFQGPTFPDREGFLTSSDQGVSFHYNFAQNWGDVHAGFYNGEGYGKTAEPNNQKAFQVRASVRPLAHGAMAARGWRVTGFYDGDAYVRDGEKRRAVFNTTFEHKYVNWGFDFLDAKDQTSVTKASVHARGWSTWLTPKYAIASRPGASLEALFRYDHLEPNRDLSGTSKRTIAGVAYWFPHQGNVSTALLFDVDNTTFDGFAPSKPTQRRIAIHGLVNF
jgi:hypothetical protein